MSDPIASEKERERGEEEEENITEKQFYHNHLVIQFANFSLVMS